MPLTTEQKAARAAYARQYRKLHPGDPRKGKRAGYCAMYRLSKGYELARDKYRASKKFKEMEARRRTREARKISARCAVKDARRAGKIVKPDACCQCGSGMDIQAHHPDYSKPLLVRWLCRPCHEREHGK